ncbi:MAG TPA: hypothetical protein VFI28_03350 [Candidatus Limnocylindrales bacterium]|nr:hypothetical protein [Candidatus Limnocylindrales bacterium]
MTRNGEAITVTASQVGPTGPIEPAERAVALRLARLHLRLGSLGLARAELEACAGSGELDEAALLDLAEVRWRTGDLPGAGEAAAAAMATGDDSGLALVIAAEAAAASSRPAEARRLAGQALEATTVPLDQLFAGMPQSSIWPHDARAGEPTGGVGTGEAGESAPGGGSSVTAEPSTRAGLVGRVRPSTGAHGHVIEHRLDAASPALAPASTLAGMPALEPRAVLTVASDEIAAGRTARAAARLALLLRVTPDAAEPVLRIAAGGRGPDLALVRGDALQLLGRDDEAASAYSDAATALDTMTDDPPEGPGAAARPELDRTRPLADRRPPDATRPSS